MEIVRPVTHTGQTAELKRKVKRHIATGYDPNAYTNVIGVIDLESQPAYGLAAAAVTNSTTLRLYNRGASHGSGVGVGPIASRHQPGSAPAFAVWVDREDLYVPLAYAAFTVADSTYTNACSLYTTSMSLTDLYAGQFSANTTVGTAITTSDNKTFTLPSGVHDYFLFFSYVTAE